MQGLSALKLLFDNNYRGEVLQLIGERVLPAMLGILIILIGIAFVIAGSKDASLVSTITEAVATKGASLVK